MLVTATHRLLIDVLLNKLKKISHLTLVSNENAKKTKTLCSFLVRTKITIHLDKC